MGPDYTFQFRFSSRIRPKHVHFDIVTLFDVVLVIALFLFVSHTTAIRPAVDLTLPQANFVDGVPQGSMVVTVTKERLFFFNDERTTLEGLSSAFSQMAFNEDQATLIIEADKSIPYDLLMQVYNKAQFRGIKQISLAIDVSPPEPGDPAP